MERDMLDNQDVSLLDVLDAVLEKGVVLRGDITISIADIDLVYLDLRILLSSVDTLIDSAQGKRQATDKGETIRSWEKEETADGANAATSR
ncbi:gas vesicle protein [Sediminibacillus albus]|uniref:Gas vesicle protein n=1 Tax=Sediminibacillus albus TaxID=407036 RepID=A0A1G8Y4G7_9BACI|nr:gas vesicle protein [Sediminibacillus albus]SDJ97728.1 Gas vesicle protein [Sediminibacillus albus]